jgi:hypothetical protein
MSGVEPLERVWQNRFTHTRSSRQPFDVNACAVEGRCHRPRRLPGGNDQRRPVREPIERTAGDRRANERRRIDVGDTSPQDLVQVSA